MKAKLGSVQTLKGLEVMILFRQLVPIEGHEGLDK